MGGRARQQCDSPAPKPPGNGVVGEGVGAGCAPRREPAAARDVDIWGQAVSLTAADVAEIMRLVEQSGFDELTLEIDGMKLSLRRGGSAEGAAGGVSAVDVGAVDAASGAGAQSAAAAAGAAGTPGAAKAP